MAKRGFLGGFELLVLVALIRLGDGPTAYYISDAIEGSSGREVASAASTSHWHASNATASCREAGRSHRGMRRPGQVFPHHGRPPQCGRHSEHDEPVAGVPLRGEPHEHSATTAPRHPGACGVGRKRESLIATSRTYVHSRSAGWCWRQVLMALLVSPRDIEITSSSPRAPS